MWNGLKASGAGCKGGADWARGAGAGAILICCGGGTASGI